MHQHNMKASESDTLSVPKDISDLGFLISQVGDQSRRRFGELVEPLGLRLSHVGVLRAIHAEQGPTQRDLGSRLGMFASNLVKLVDELEQMGLLQRMRHAEDRRSYQLQLTNLGKHKVSEIEGKVREHQAQMCSALTPAQREELYIPSKEHCKGSRAKARCSPRSLPNV